MNEISLLTTLAVIHFIALMSPGPDFALIVQNTAQHGRRIGLSIALGLACGILTHSLLSLTGISVLIHHYPVLESLSQFIGGSYLTYLGLTAMYSVWKSRQTSTKYPSDTTEHHTPLYTDAYRAFRQGYMTNILNPKALVFFTSLMSTLVPSSMSLLGKSFALCILFSLALFWFSLLAWALSTKKIQRKLDSLSNYITLICGLFLSTVGCSILWFAFESL